MNEQENKCCDKCINDHAVIDKYPTMVCPCDCHTANTDSVERTQLSKKLTKSYLLRQHNRFLTKVKKRTNGCWDWLGSISPKGYGWFYFDKKNGRAHRYSYLYFKGYIPSGLTIDHLCKNRKCVNPKHLEAVTMKENVLRGDGVTAQNARKKVCKYGHPLKGTNLILKKRGRLISRSCRKCGIRHCKEWRNRRDLKQKLTSK